MHDTSPEMEELVRRRYSEMSPQERIRIGAEMFDTARAIMLASFPPGLSENETRRLMARRLYGALFEHVYQTKPLSPGLPGPRSRTFP